MSMMCFKDLLCSKKNAYFQAFHHFVHLVFTIQNWDYKVRFSNGKFKMATKKSRFKMANARWLPKIPSQKSMSGFQMPFVNNPDFRFLLLIFLNFVTTYQFLDDLQWQLSEQVVPHSDEALVGLKYNRFMSVFKASVALHFSKTFS